MHFKDESEGTQANVKAMITVLSPAGAPAIPLAFGPYEVLAAWDDGEPEAFSGHDETDREAELMLFGKDETEAEGTCWRERWFRVVEVVFGLPEDVLVESIDDFGKTGDISITTSDANESCIILPQVDFCARIGQYLRAQADGLALARTAFDHAVGEVFGAGSIVRYDTRNTVTVETTKRMFGRSEVWLRLNLRLWDQDRIDGRVDMLAYHPQSRGLPYLSLYPITIAKAPPLAEAVTRALWQHLNTVREWAGLIMAGLHTLQEGVFPSWQKPSGGK